MNIEDKFGSHVKSVFDNYEDGMADQGWAELLKKYPEQELGPAPSGKIVPMRIWWAAAAVVILACFTLFVTTERPAENIQSAAKKEIHTPKTPYPGTPEIDNMTPEPPAALSSNRPGNNMVAASVKTGFSGVTPSASPALITGPIQESQQTVQSIEPQQGTLQTPEKLPEQQTPAARREEGPVAVAATTEDLERKPASIEEFLEGEAKNNTALASNGKKPQALTSFDIYAGTFLNYFEDNPAKVNAGFGVNANVKLTRKIYLSVGAGISENTVAYENSLPRSSVESLTSSFPLNQADHVVGKPGAGGFVGPSEPHLTFAAKTSGPSTDVKLNATLLNLDVPIAIKFYAGKNDRFYLLTGVNSNSYINQRYMQTYSTYNYVSSMTETNEQEVEGSRLNGFDFANSAIFAIGVSQDLGKTTTLTFEPFYRPSLKGLGDKNIRLNTLGVNLKLNIGRNN